MDDSFSLLSCFSFFCYGGTSYRERLVLSAAADLLSGHENQHCTS